MHCKSIVIVLGISTNCISSQKFVNADLASAKKVDLSTYKCAISTSACAILLQRIELAL